MKSISGVDAWNTLALAKHTKWRSDIGRFDAAPLKIFHRPKFKLDQEENYFCIGSCFARNIEEHLIYRGKRVLSKRIVSPKRECPFRTNAFVNKFTTMSIVNELRWAHNPPAVDKSFFDELPIGWHDLQLSPNIPTVTLGRAIERRVYLIEEYFARIRQATVAIVTLGLNEVWKDTLTDAYLNRAPTLNSVKRAPDRYVMEITDVVQNLHELKSMRELFKALNPNIRIVVTVSPVPMSDTFSGQDVAVANMRSKSTLRVAADQFASEHEDVDYFPSYDMVAMAPRAFAYATDYEHVSNHVVGKVIGLFLKLYADIETVATPFAELAYLAANPDVEDLVRLGELESGYEHWLTRGQRDGRPLKPAVPSRAMVVAGER